MVSLDKVDIPGPSRRADAVRPRFSLGGVALELLPEPGFAWTLPAETAQHVQPSYAASDAPKLAAVTCSVRVDPSLLASAGDHPSVRWEQTADGVCVRARQVALDIAALGPRRYVVAARIAQASLLTLMLNTLVTSVAELAGGLCLHATAIAHGAGAVLLLGPSGAGKTTAAELLAGDVTCLSNDRVTLVPDPLAPGKFWVWSLPVGKAPDIARCGEVALPLVALLRVMQAKASTIAPLREVEALLQIRQAVEVGAGSEFFEPRRLLAVGALAAAAKSGVAHIALSPSWRAQLEAFLATAPVGQDSPEGGPVHRQKSGARVDEAGS
jgi:hypothetical protein